MVDDALAEIVRLPGRHLYFLDDHLLGNVRFARDLFRGMRGMGRVFQGAATVDSILRDDLIEEAAAAGLRSVFVGFETLSSNSLEGAGKRQNLGPQLPRGRAPARQSRLPLGFHLSGRVSAQVNEASDETLLLRLRLEEV